MWKTVTKTTLLRDAVTLALQEVENNKSRCADAYLMRCFEEEERDLQNVMETLNLGFDPSQFDEILECNSGSMVSSAVRYSSFNYFLYVPLGGIYYVGLFFKPAKKTFSLVVREPVDEHTLFSYEDIVLEQITYCTRDHFAPTVPYTGEFQLEDLPRITILGKFFNIPVRIQVDKRHCVLKGGEKIDELLAGGPLYLSLPLTTREARKR